MKAILILLLTASPCFAQIKIEGPTEATVGYMCKLKLDIQADDPKITCFPANDQDWIASQDFTGQKWIIYVPGKKTLEVDQTTGKYIPKHITFVVAGNKDKKTFLQTHELKVIPDGEPAPGPGPVPEGLAKKLADAYGQAPSAEFKAKLIEVYEGAAAQAAAGIFQNFAAADNYLKVNTPQRVGTALQPVRNAVADELVATMGQKGSTWDKDKFVAKMKQIAAILRTFK